MPSFKIILAHIEVLDHFPVYADWYEAFSFMKRKVVVTATVIVVVVIGVCLLIFSTCLYIFIDFHILRPPPAECGTKVSI